MLRPIEYIVAAQTFDDFLAHAEVYHGANRKMEAAVLASAVLEDTMKKIAVKNGTLDHGSLEQIIEGLAKIDIVNPVRKRHLEAYAATRNKAFHAEWDHFDIREVGKMVAGIRELIEEFLAR